MIAFMNSNEFIVLIWQHYADHARDMPWRSNPEPYWVLVSEVMLQQTQVSRVTPKFEQFITRFPNIEQLAEASLSNVLSQWSGLGYNRRAKFLQLAAQQIVATHNRAVPDNQAALEALPGIGPNTAGAILAYAYNQPVVFIETNIRSVYLHHFFNGQIDVDDRDVRRLVAATLDHANPREWYWALMDYGSWLKQQTPNPSRASRHHSKQDQFEGSVRQLRSKILQKLLEGPQDIACLHASMKDARSKQVLKVLIDEGLVQMNKNFAYIE